MKPGQIAVRGTALSAVIAVVVGLFVIGCTARPSTSQDSRDRDGSLRTVVPQSTDSIRLTNETGETNGTDDAGPQDELEQAAQEIPSTHVDLDPDIVPILIVDEDIRRTGSEQQLVAFKHRDDPEDVIRILVVDFNLTRGDYEISWEGTTQSTSIRDFSLYFDDVTGDHRQEIVATGVGDNQRQTLDVFRRVGEGGERLKYEPIISLASDGSIDIEEASRDAPYYDEGEPGSSHRIVREEPDPDGDSAMDRTATTYEFDPSTEEFQETDVESISADQTEAEELQALHEGGSDAFRSFLDGAWYRETGRSGTEVELLTFDPRGERVVFYGGDMQEVFQWQSTHATATSGVQLTLQNEKIRSFNTPARIRIENLDSIAVSISASDRWDGIYRKLSDGLREQVLHTEERYVELSDLSPRGTYRNDDGVEISFNDGRFAFRDGDENREGAYGLFEINHTVLEMLSYDESGRSQSRDVYIVSYDEETIDDSRVERTLHLKPAELHAGGVREAPHEPAVRVRQVEELE